MFAYVDIAYVIESIGNYTKPPVINVSLLYVCVCVGRHNVTCDTRITVIYKQAGRLRADVEVGEEQRCTRTPC